MKKFYTNIINDKNKELNWRNSNFCYVTTILFMFILIATFLWCESAITKILDQNLHWNIFLLPFRHSDWLHLFGNLECFFFVSLFLERRYGSLKYLLIVLITIPLSPLVWFAVTGCAGRGESLVNFFLFGIFFVEIFAHFHECFLTKYQNIFTIVTILLVLVLMSFTKQIQFSLLTTLLTFNHGSAFIEGLLVGIFSKLTARSK